MDENDPRVHKSQEIPIEKDFDLASENGKLKERIKELEAGLQNGEKLAEERIVKVKNEKKRYGTAYNVISAIEVVLAICMVWILCSQAVKIEKLRSKLKTASEEAALTQEKYTYTPNVTLVRTRDGGEYISKQDFFSQLEGAGLYFRSQIEKLEKEGAEKAKAEVAVLQNKFDAEKAELQKKLDEISATTAAEKVNQLTKQKKMAEELVRSWCGVPVVNAPEETSQSTAPDTGDTKQNKYDWLILLKNKYGRLILFVLLALFATPIVRALMWVLIEGLYWLVGRG